MRASHLYVHVPFCARRCAYCDFAIAVRQRVPVDDFLHGVARELELRFADAPPAALSTLYLGGGTPSSLGGTGIQRLLDLVRARFELEPGAEVTIEANPDDVSLAAADAWVAAGVNRLSLGAQSFDSTVLTWMHRTHSAQQIGTAVRHARLAGIADLSLDLIFALPESLGRDWGRDLALALELEPEHVSLYGLTVEPATPLGRWVDRGETREAPEERYSEEFLLADQTLVAAGFEHYEVSSFCRPGRRARHNSSYWLGVPFHGVGPSAHGFDGARRRWNERNYATWLERVHSGIDPLQGSELLDEENRGAEGVYLGLRTLQGLPLRGGELPLVTRWVDEGWARIEGDRLILTAQGWLRMDALAASLTAHRSR